MTSSRSVTQGDVNALPLSPEELEIFGWIEEGEVTPIVVSTRAPDGRRDIPTRQKTSTGEVIYGSILTAEPPPNVDPDAWALAFFGTEETPTLFRAS